MYKNNPDIEGTLDEIVGHIRVRFGRGSSQLSGVRIAEAIGQMVSVGDLQPGQKLPTVRALSARLHVSPGTVSYAWATLRTHSVIITDRRRGTTVRSTTGTIDGRYWHVPVEPGTLTHDLSTGNPDGKLLPSLTDALKKVQLHENVTSYLDKPMLPELEEILRSRWPFTPHQLSVVDGAQDALDRSISSLLHLGDYAIVEDPTFPPMIDMIELSGARPLPVRSDNEGLLPDHLEKALELNPTALFLQPRSQNPTGITMSANRCMELAKLLAGRSITIVEDDHSGRISGTPIFSLGEYLPEQVLHIHSFSKSHGPDLRLAAISGPENLLGPIIKRRHLGPSWSSRLLQRILLELLRDPTVEQGVADTATAYAARRSSVVASLHEVGIPVRLGTGLNIWVPVNDEQSTIVNLAAHGIGVAPGRPFMVEPSAQDFIRITLSSSIADYGEIAKRIAMSHEKRRSN